MSKPDKQVGVVLIILILAYGSVLIAGSVSHRLSFLTSLVNLFTGLSVIIYWLQKQIKIKQHRIESREIIVLIIEMLLIVSAAYIMITQQWHHWLRMVQYVFFGIHLIILLFFLVFILTFKIKKLF